MIVGRVEPDGHAVYTTVPLPLMVSFYGQFPPSATMDATPDGALFVRDKLEIEGPKDCPRWTLSGGWIACHLRRGQPWAVRGFSHVSGPADLLRTGLSEDGRLLQSWGPAPLDLECPVLDFVPDSAVQWIRTGDRDLSSEALCKGLFPSAPLPKQMAVPRDLLDFERCVSLLDQVDPDGARLRNLVPMSRAWGTLLHHWQELLLLYRGHASEALAARLEALSRPMR